MPRVAGARLPLAFIASGLLALVVGADWLSADARVPLHREPGHKAFALGTALLALAPAAGLAFTIVHGARLRFAVSCGIGALSFTALRMLCKIVPFLVRMRTYGPRAGRQSVPLATALGFLSAIPVPVRPPAFST